MTQHQCHCGGRACSDFCAAQTYSEIGRVVVKTQALIASWLDWTAATCDDVSARDALSQAAKIIRNGNWKVPGWRGRFAKGKNNDNDHQRMA